MYKLRELIREDISLINAWRNKPELVAGLGAPFRFINCDVDYKWFENYMNNRSTNVRCSIIDTEKDELIGLISLTNIDHINQSAELHIMIGEERDQRKGVGSFATMEMLNHAFYNLNLQRIELTVLDTNEKAQRFYEKNGFVREGTKKKAKYKNGDFTDVHMYALLRNEYNKKNQTNRRSI